MATEHPVLLTRDLARSAKADLSSLKRIIRLGKGERKVLTISKRLRGRSKLIFLSCTSAAPNKNRIDFWAMQVNTECGYDSRLLWT